MALEQPEYEAVSKQDDDLQVRLARAEDALHVANETMDLAGTSYVELQERFDALSIGIQLGVIHEEVARDALREQLVASEKENTELHEEVEGLRAELAALKAA